MAKEKAGGLLCFLLALIVVLIVVIGGGAYYFLVADNGEEIEENKDSIVLDGLYALQNSHVFWEFNKNGTVEKSGDISAEVGTYTVNDRKEINITYIQETVWIEDVLEESTKKEVKAIERKEKLKYIDEKTLKLEEDILIKQDVE